MFNKNIILYYGISFLRSIVLGMLQYFLWSHLKNQGVSLEKIAWYISLGMTVAYLIGWALSRTFKKRNLTIFFTIISLMSISSFFFVGLIPLNVFMILTSIIWFSYGIWAIIKHIILSFEIQHSGLRETAINWVLSFCTITWTLFGSYMGVETFKWWWINWYFSIIWLMIVVILMTVPLKYDGFFRKKKFKESLKAFLPGMKDILKKYYWLLLPIGILRSISIWFMQKIFYLWIDIFSIAPQKAIFIYIYSVVGAIIWFVISAIFYKRKKLFIMVSTTILVINLIFFLRLVSWFPKYIILEISSLIIGILFGILINILEWRYFWHIGRDHDKEYWAAIYWVIVNLVNFAMMLFVNFLMNNYSVGSAFVFFGIILFMTLFMYKNFNKEHYAFEQT